MIIIIIIGFLVGQNLNSTCSHPKKKNSYTLSSFTCVTETLVYMLKMFKAGGIARINET